MRQSALGPAGLLLLKINETSEEDKNYHGEGWLVAGATEWNPGRTLMAVTDGPQRVMQRQESQANLRARVKPNEARSCIKQPAPFA